jgi:single-strand DNA-binding protein
VNKVVLIGRCTRDVEPIAGGKGAKGGLAVNNRKKGDNGEWEDVPVFIDFEVWNRGDGGTQATRFMESVKKGHQVFIEGHLKMDTWEDKNGGGKRTALRVVVDNYQFLEAKPQGMTQGARRQPVDDGADYQPPQRRGMPGDDDEDQIPF